MENKNEVVFPKAVMETLKTEFELEEKDLLSEINFATAKLNTLTNKLTFNSINYEVEGSADLEVYIYDTKFYIEFGEIDMEFSLLDNLQLEGDNQVIINKLNEITI